MNVRHGQRAPHDSRQMRDVHGLFDGEIAENLLEQFFVGVDQRVGEHAGPRAARHQPAHVVKFLQYVFSNGQGSGCPHGYSRCRGFVVFAKRGQRCESATDADGPPTRIGRRTGSAAEASVAAPSAAMLSCNSRSGQTWLSVLSGRPARASRSDRKDRKLFVVPQGCCKPSGRGSAWLERLVRDQEVDGSNPFAPTTSFRMSDLSHTRNRKSAWCETKQPVRQISQLLPYIQCVALKFRYPVRTNYVQTIFLNRKTRNKSSTPVASRGVRI